MDREQHNDTAAEQDQFRGNADEVGGGVAGGTSGETGSASGSDASPDEASGSIVADERTEPAREDERRDNPRGPGLQPRPDLRGA